MCRCVEQKMRKGIHTASAIFFFAGTAGAFVFALLGEFLYTLMVLVGAAVFFAVFLLTDAKPKKSGISEPSYNQYTDYMRYCPSCGYLGSQPSGESVPPCPKCGRALIATYTPLSDFAVLTKEERKNLIRQWQIRSANLKD